MDPVYILIRTSRRPEYFRRMMETVKSQTYKNIVTIVHSDDPRDNYIEGDVIIKGTAYGPEYGNGPYNLYNNRLLKAIPGGSGWYHFIDDDDEYAAPDVIEKFVNASKRDHINIARVVRWNGVVFPKDWGKQCSYQTECFFLHTDHKSKAKWWAHLGGDHDYSKKLTRILPQNWIDNLTVCRAQTGKGHGRRLDINGKFNNNFDQLVDDNKMVAVVGLRPYKGGQRREWIRQGELKNILYKLAIELESKGIVKITYPGDYVSKPAIRRILVV
jgi:hypothetical protein